MLLVVLEECHLSPLCLQGLAQQLLAEATEFLAMSHSLYSLLSGWYRPIRALLSPDTAVPVLGGECCCAVHQHGLGSRRL